MEGKRQETEAQREVSGEAFPEGPGVSMSSPD